MGLYINFGYYFHAAIIMKIGSTLFLKCICNAFQYSLISFNSFPEGSFSNILMSTIVSFSSLNISSKNSFLYLLSISFTFPIVVYFLSSLPMLKKYSAVVFSEIAFFILFIISFDVSSIIRITSFFFNLMVYKSISCF